MTETMTIVAKGALILSAAAIGERNDRQLAAGEQADVPYSYGLHLVSDKFAEEFKPDEPPAAPATKSSRRR